MKSPLKIEKEIFKDMYDSQKKKHRTDTEKKFYEEITKSLTTCQNFIEKIRKQFLDKGDPKQDMNEIEKLNFLQYLYGNLMQGFVDQNK